MAMFNSKLFVYQSVLNLQIRALPNLQINSFALVFAARRHGGHGATMGRSSVAKIRWTLDAGILQILIMVWKNLQ